jgi:hypothetical protein
MESGLGDRALMFCRAKFVTNSSSTSFVAWGYVLPEELFSKRGDDDFFDILYEEGGEEVGGTRDDNGQIIIYSRATHIDADDYGTVSFDSPVGENYERWEENLRAFAKMLGADLANLKPGWFFTKYSS